MSPKRHYPKESQKTDDEEIQTPFKNSPCFILYENVNHSPKGKRVKYSQLVGQIFKKITPSETATPIAQMVFETGKIIDKLPLKMGEEA
ncbi:hypothetical protein FACS1894199_16160 [Bacteroidia bacterium]|nr:hypothetical protein FACS1894199_16160 [Bacteroidia bacterium]